MEQNQSHEESVVKESPQKPALSEKDLKDVSGLHTRNSSTDPNAEVSRAINEWSSVKAFSD